MALKLDNTLLTELGLDALPESEKQLLLRQIYEKLEMNVGMRLADQMSNEQLDAFEKFVDANDDKGAFQWLETNFPNYKMVVNEEFEKLKAEIRSLAPQILAAAQQQAAAGQTSSAGAQQFAGQPQPGGPTQQSAPSVPPPQFPGQSQPTQPGFVQQPGYQQVAAPGTQPTTLPSDTAAMPNGGHLQPQYGGAPSQPPAADHGQASNQSVHPGHSGDNGQQGHGHHQSDDNHPSQ